MKNILITGGTGNLGKTVVQTLSNADYHLHLAVRKLAEENGKHKSYYQADLADSEQAASFVEAILGSAGGIDAGIFLAGGFAPGALENTKVEDIQKMVEINFATAFTIVKRLVAHFRTTGGGKLIFIGSNAAMNVQSASHSLAYSLSKKMLYDFSELLNASEKDAGISAHILLPETIDTETNRSAMPGADFSKWIKTESIAQTILDIIDGKEPRTVIPFS
jgi:NAD(P)-dependent dehydrogenase (short-subunit alcohol dehydrogenase family)